MKVILLIAFLLGLTQQGLIDVSPKNYYVGELVTFVFKFSEDPTNINHTYLAADGTKKPFGKCTIFVSLKEVYCAGIQFNTPGQIKIYNSATPEQLLTTITVSDGQKIIGIFPSVFPYHNQDVEFKFEKEIDVAPEISAIGSTMSRDGQSCTVTDKFYVKCSFAFGTAAVTDTFTIHYNKVETTQTITLSRPDYLPKKYYRGETVTYSFTFKDADHVPTIHDYTFKYFISSSPNLFSNCKQNGLVLECPFVRVDISADILVVNTDSPPITLIKYTTRDTQDLPSIVPSTFGKERTEVTFTFSEEYDLVPIIKAIGATKTVDATDCALQADAKIVKCFLTIDTIGDYSIIYNGKDSRRPIKIQEATVGPTTGGTTTGPTTGPTTGGTTTGPTTGGTTTGPTTGGTTTGGTTTGGTTTGGTTTGGTTTEGTTKDATGTTGGTTSGTTGGTTGGTSTGNEKTGGTLKGEYLFLSCSILYLILLF